MRGDRANNRPGSRADGGRLRRWITRGLWVLVLGAGLGVAADFNRVWLLTDMAKVWVVEDPVAKADAIVVLGGGAETRPFAAAKLYHAGVAPLILYMNVKLTPAQKLGIIPAEAEETREILLRNGIPASAARAIGTDVGNTYDEACAVRAWDARSGARSILIVTDLFHTRRARWIFQKQLRGTGVQVHIEGVPTLGYETNNWWKNEEGVIGFQNEVMKYVYYRLAH